MKSFARPSFFRAFDLFLSMTNPGMKKSRWVFERVECERERYSFASARHNVVIEIFILTHPGARSWSLMVTKEYWSTGISSIRNTRWAKPIRGNRLDILKWIQTQEAIFSRDFSLTRQRESSVEATDADKSSLAEEIR